MGGADQLPFDVACAQAASSEPADPADLLDLAEHRLDRVRSIAAMGGVVHPVWTDRRASLAPSLNEEVFTATLTP